jgi:hypothetical protein
LEGPIAGVGLAGESTVWGRGAIDDKNNLVAQLGAVEELLLAGFTPRRTLWLAFGHDEETGGFEGAGHIAAFFRARVVALGLGRIVALYYTAHPLYTGFNPLYIPDSLTYSVPPLSETTMRPNPRLRSVSCSTRAR